jgi:hypothetical protein
MPASGFTPTSNQWPLERLTAGYWGQEDNPTNTALQIVVTLVAIPAVAIFVNVVQQLVSYPAFDFVAYLPTY